MPSSPSPPPDPRPYRLRDARPDDFELVFRIKRSAMKEYVAATWGWDEAEQRRISRRRFEAGDTEIVLVEDEPVGTLRVVRSPEEIRLLTIFLLAEWQSRGVGSAIVGDILSEADDTVRPIRLRVLRVNERARTFYERFGFAVVETTETHVVMRLSPRG